MLSSIIFIRTLKPVLIYRWLPREANVYIGYRGKDGEGGGGGMGVNISYPDDTVFIAESGEESSGRGMVWARHRRDGLGVNNQDDRTYRFEKEKRGTQAVGMSIDRRRVRVGRSV